MRFYLAGVFAWSAGGKFLWADEWGAQLLSMRFFSPEWVPSITHVFPALELGLAA